MKDIWTDEAETIRKEIDFLIENKSELFCARRAAENSAKLIVVGKTINEKKGPIFVVRHSHEPTCSSDTCSFYYRSQDDSLRSFRCKRLKKAEGFVGFEFPEQIVDNQRRKYERVTTPSNSVVAFFFQHKEKMCHGIVGDVSVEGAKLLVDIPGPLASGVILSPLTLTLCFRMSDIQNVIMLPEAEIIWSHCENEITTKVGIKFIASEENRDDLMNYIELRSMEESIKSHVR